jgi:hypothetical protein
MRQGYCHARGGGRNETPPGEYALLRLIPHTKDGKPHLIHGMMKQVTVQ